MRRKGNGTVLHLARPLRRIRPLRRRDAALPALPVHAAGRSAGRTLGRRDRCPAGAAGAARTRRGQWRRRRCTGALHNVWRLIRRRDTIPLPESTEATEGTGSTRSNRETENTTENIWLFLVRAPLLSFSVLNPLPPSSPLSVFSVVRLLRCPSSPFPVLKEMPDAVETIIPVRDRRRRGPFRGPRIRAARTRR